MTTLAKSFTAVGVGPALNLRHKHSFDFSVSGTFVGTVALEKSVTGGLTWEAVTSKTAAATGTIYVENKDQGQALYRFNCTAFTSGTIVTSIADVAQVLREYYDDNGNLIMRINDTGVPNLKRLSQKRLVPAALGKPGTTSGFVQAAADNISLATCPASKTASTFVLPLTGLKVGDTITGFHLIGQIESAGGAVTVDANLRKMTAAAADVTDASVASITQISVVADTAITLANSLKDSLSQLVAADESYYILVTVTTAASTDVGLQAAAVIVDEA